MSETLGESQQDADPEPPSRLITFASRTNLLDIYNLNTAKRDHCFHSKNHDITLMLKKGTYDVEASMTGEVLKYYRALGRCPLTKNAIGNESKVEELQYDVEDQMVRELAEIQDSLQPITYGRMAFLQSSAYYSSAVFIEPTDGNAMLKSNLLEQDDEQSILQFESSDVTTIKKRQILLGGFACFAAKLESQLYSQIG